MFILNKISTAHGRGVYESMLSTVLALLTKL
ncbi:DNA polymerase [Bacillus phage BSTP3]|nr:DNA polymerase [Bacillus phage BSTP3]